MSFKSLVCAVSEQCQEIKQAMASFPYFDTWDGNVVAECCRVSSLAEFPPDEIVLGPGTGDSHAVHFILNGVCKMVQHLQVELGANSRRKATRKLHKPPDSTTPERKDERYLSRLFTQKRSLQAQENGDHTLTECRKQADAVVVHYKMEDVVQCPSKSNLKTEETGKSREGFSGNENETEKPPPEREDCEDAKTECLPVGEETEVSNSEKKIVFEPDHHLKVLQECKQRREEAICVLESRSLPERPANVKSLFMQTGILYTGASFGSGELGKENFVMSWTAVKVLKIPLRFLLQHNPCNIWNRISLFYSLHLFRDEKVFRYYQNDQKWTERKKKQTEEIGSLKKIPNYTLICDVPYWIRLTSTR